MKALKRIRGKLPNDCIEPGTKMMVMITDVEHPHDNGIICADCGDEIHRHILTYDNIEDNDILMLEATDQIDDNNNGFQVWRVVEDE